MGFPISQDVCWQVLVHGWQGQRAVAWLLYTSEAADGRSSVDLGGCRIIKKKTREVS